jgi:hypothetical protein
MLNDIKPEHIKLTCRNHPKAQYLTKGIGHGLAFVGADPTYVRRFYLKRYGSGFLGTRNMLAAPDRLVAASLVECPCPASDLIEVEEFAPYNDTLDEEF